MKIPNHIIFNNGIKAVDINVFVRKKNNFGNFKRIGSIH